MIEVMKANLEVRLAHAKATIYSKGKVSMEDFKKVRYFVILLDMWREWRNEYGKLCSKQAALNKLNKKEFHGRCIYPIIIINNISPWEN